MVKINCLQIYTLFNIQVYHIIEFLRENLDVLHIKITGSVNPPTVGPDVFGLSSCSVALLFATREVKQLEDQPSSSKFRPA